MSANEHDYTTEITYRSYEEEGGTQVFFAIDSNSHLLVDEAPVQSNAVEVTDADSNYAPNYKREAPGSASGYWSEADAHMLLRVYLKHLKEMGTVFKKPDNLVWDSIINEFMEKKKYSRTQIKTKILRLKSTARGILSGRMDNATWPFLTATTEILRLEGESGDNIATAEKRGLWTQEETDLLINEYGINQVKLLSDLSAQSKRLIWNQIAVTLGRQRHQVTLKMHSLKNTWRKWKESGACYSDWPHLSKMSELMSRDGEDKVVATTKVARKIVRGRWDINDAKRLLQNYYEILTQNENDETLTRLEVCTKLAMLFNRDVDTIQGKLNNLKRDWTINAQIKSESISKEDEMWNDIIRLESKIWNESEPVFLEEHEPLPPAPKRMKKKMDNVIVEVEAANDFRKVEQPAWIDQHRKDLARRHNESMAIKYAMVNHLEKLLNHFKSSK